MEYSDTQRPGLRLRAYASGARVWIFEKRIKHGAKRKHRLGTYPEVGIKEARRQAMELHVEAERGFDRVQHEHQKRSEAEERERRQMTVRQVLDVHAEAHCAHLRTGPERVRELRRALGEHLDVPIGSLSRGTIQNIVDAKAREGAPVLASRWAAYLAQFFKFAWQREYIEEHFARGISKPTKEHARERVLSIDELQAIWRASASCGPLWGPLARLLITTAQRRHQIGRMTWRDVKLDEGMLLFGSRQTKNSDWGHFVHLSSFCIHELRSMKSKSLERWGTEGHLDRPVFTTNGRTASSGYSKFKGRLDEMLGEGFGQWTLHDLRTAFATTMCDRGHEEGVVDRVLNHAAVSSAPSAVARVYNRAKKMPERKAVVLEWAELVTEKSLPVTEAEPATGISLAKGLN